MKRNNVFQFKLSDEEKKTLTAIADHNGFSSVSDYIRAAALGKITVNKLPLNKLVEIYNDGEEE